MQREFDLIDIISCFHLIRPIPQCVWKYQKNFFTADMLDAYNVTNAGKNFQGDQRNNRLQKYL